MMLIKTVENFFLAFRADTILFQLWNRNTLYVFFRYGVYAVDFDSPTKERTLTTFGQEYKTVMSNNGFPTVHLTDLLPLETADIQIPIEANFTMLPASEIPSAASVSVWEVRIIYYSLLQVCAINIVC